MAAVPLPSKLVFLSELPTLEPLTRVRFLGCVTSYSRQTGRLHLQHAYAPDAETRTPSTSAKDIRSTAPLVAALVDISLVADDLEQPDTSVGAWVNVVGYVEPRPEMSKVDAWKPSIKPETAPKRCRRQQSKVAVNVQAQVLWSAGAFDVAAYERAVEGRKRIVSAADSD